MTPKERAVAYAKGEEVDRLPTSLSANETTPPRYGYKIKDYYFSADIMVDVETRLAEEFHADNMGIGLGLRTVVEALGTELEMPDNAVSYIKKPALNSFDEVDRLEIRNIEKDGRFPIICEATSRLYEKFGHERGIGSGLAGPFTTAASLIGFENFLKGTIKNKEGVHKLLQFSTDCVVEVSRQMNAKFGMGLMLSEPMGSKDLISRRQFDEFFAPYVKQAVERMNEFQGGTGIHICGATRDRWDGVVETGINSFWIDNCESLEEMKKLFGDRIAISGNVPPATVLNQGTPEDVDAAVKKCIMEAADNPMGYRLCPGCTTPVGTSAENMIAFMNAAAKYGRNARKGCMPEGIKDYL